jgi:putative ABC transport system substrate-binding protein
MTLTITRRQFGAALGGAAAWPIAVRAQQRAMITVGFLDSRSPDIYADRLRAFSEGLKENGYVEGENVAIDYRWAENQIERLPALAADLVSRRVAVIVTIGGAATTAAQAATRTTPIVFAVGEDPVKLGLVKSIARPEGNLTGINFFNTELTAKRFALLRELAPKATRVRVLVNRANPSERTDSTTMALESGARAVGVTVEFVNASTPTEIDTAFEAMARDRPHALFVGSDTFFNLRRMQLVLLATRHAIPTSYPTREYVDLGGLTSYGASLLDTYRQDGLYVGRILKGAKPSDLPVVQPSKFELVINHQAARAIGIPVPPSLIALADEVIE